MSCRTFLAVVLLLSALPHSLAQSVRAQQQGETVYLENDALLSMLSVHGGVLHLQSVTNHFTGSSIVPGEAFELIPKEGPVVRASDLKVVSGPTIEDAPVSSTSSKAAEHLPGKQISLGLEDASGNLQVAWKLILRQDANYVRQEVTFHAAKQPIALAQIVLLDSVIANSQVSGHAKGSPVTAYGWFLGFEHPLSECRVRSERASCWLSRELPIQAGQSVTYSSVIGAAHPSQLRRDFLGYIEFERAHPYRTFLHYNTWYDLGYHDRYTEQQLIASMRGFGEQLAKQRGVKLDSFMLDDGWDDPTTLWHFNPGFPDGLTNVAKVAASYGGAPGIWFSPWGGYDKPKEQRLASARARGFETNDGGFALSGPKYYRYFRDACFSMIDKYGVNQFKFDGTGNANEVIPGSQFDSDFDAAIHLIGELRAKKPDIYINLTTGTYPSPFWLLYADSIWRGGDDHSFAGVGSSRQRWITYRDSQTYRHVVEEGPLFPLNSLMLHGMIYAQDAERLGTDPGHDFPDEVHSYFGTGTQLQEMYITPSLLSSQDWDVLAESAIWSRANAQVLKDAHWIGGDPARLEIYGWAAWTPEKAIITLRNPSDKPQDFIATLESLLQLPPKSAKRFNAFSPWQNDGPNQSRIFIISAQEQHAYHLKPFEVLTLELKP
ncbi:MAG TPA: enterotoxin [Candidatus Sulfotelmatobacter sp.]|nr:enterotoxin [Candidatus Sulfotelmatobacter sp.]